MVAIRLIIVALSIGQIACDSMDFQFLKDGRGEVNAAKGLASTSDRILQSVGIQVAHSNS